MPRSSIVNLQVNPTGTIPLYDNFTSGWSTTVDGFTSPNGLWHVNYLGYGFATAGNGILQASSNLSSLSAYSIQSTRTWGPGIHIRLSVRLDVQSTSNTQSWYSCWPMITAGPNTAVYFLFKTSGVEVGKKDSDLPGCYELQEYIYTGSSPVMVKGNWYTFDMYAAPSKTSSNLHIRWLINGIQVFDGDDNAVFGGNPNSCVNTNQYIGSGWQRNGIQGPGTSAFFLNAPKAVMLYGEGSQESWGPVYAESWQW